MQRANLDRIDRQLLDLLQQDARLTTAQLADKVGLSSSPCARRVRHLEESGLIQTYRAQLDRTKLGLGVTIFVHVRLSRHTESVVADFEEKVRNMDEVVNCHTVSGPFDYLLQVVSADLPGYERWVRRLQSLPAVNNIDSSFAIRSVKEHGPLPIY
ncbi:Lrp/AsnC family transcriptional regulator [Hahella sp. HN01]|uniref:Lrp/AsnC family transcriptional regulator n=1 Tax=Hahella sp. HN01 TaxID=2847262 RepID=UPI001C1EF0E5|nr:Lrp/AsnC family transcriptional regulator [Hahella sp. HN01]MBU6954468.1 Lrp/AsnC family transcriptional regulator [Hahella sp. HN01]